MILRLKWLLLVSVCLIVVVRSSGGESKEAQKEGEHGNSTGGDHEGGGISIVHLNFKMVKTPLILVCWVLLAVGVKVLYHSVEKFAKFCPESCVLIVVGVLAGLVLQNASSADDSMLIEFSANTFFLFLLPPIVFDAGYCMAPRHFFDNLGLILAFAIIGTVINSFGIGLGLYYLIQWGAINVTDIEHINGTAVDKSIDMPGCLLFGSLIAAVDPVAVLAVFDTVHVNEVLHIIVEGESLLNDAVSVVLYKILNVVVETEQAGKTMETKEFGIGFIAFLVISGGGTLIGLIYAVITAIFTRTLTHVRVVEPLVVFFFAYLSYLTAELFHWSGILAIIFCGFAMKRYVEENISRKSHTTVKYFMRLLAVISESVIFMFLGLAMVTTSLDLNPAFIGYSIILCLFFRAVVVMLFVYVSNLFRVQKIAKVDQFIMIYGGLRGAVSFSLAFILSSDLAWKNLLVTTTFAVIIFTVFIQGITIGPLVKLLHVRTHEKKKPSLNEEIIEHIIAHVMWGFEEIVGKHGENYYRQWFDHIDNTYLLRWLTNKKLDKGIKHGDAIDILQVFHNLEERDAMEMAHKHEVFDNIKGRTTGSKMDYTPAVGNVKAPQLPTVGENVPCADPNVKYQKLDSMINLDTEEDHFNVIKTRTFAAMKLNSRPVPNKRHHRHKMKSGEFEDYDSDHAYHPLSIPFLSAEAVSGNAHRSMPYHAPGPIIKRPHHHHHGHDRKKKHHGDHHHKHAEGHHGHKHRHRKKDNAAEQSNGEVSPPADQDEVRPAEDDTIDLPPINEPDSDNPIDNQQPDEVKMYEFNDTLEIDPKAHDDEHQV